MPVVTKIEQQKRRKNRYSVFVDDEYSFALSEGDLASAGIKKGQTLSPQEHAEYLRLSDISKIIEKAIRFLSFRPRSVKEVTDYLLRKGHSEDEARSVTDRLLGQKLLDDLAFARSWVESRKLLKPSSQRKLVSELRQKGIAAAVIEEVLASLDPAGEIEAIKQVAKKKLALPRYQDPRRLTAYLIRHGFSYENIKKALSDFPES